MINSVGWENAGSWLFQGPVRFAALNAVGADQDGLDRTFQKQFLFLKVGLKNPLGSLMRVAVGISGDRPFSANFTFE